MTIDIHTTVYHNLYGKGEVIKVTDENVYVLFGKKQRIFPYPDAFEKGFLLADITSQSPVINPHPITYLDPKEQSSAIVSTDPTREITLDAADNISYKTIYEALNAAVGTNYTGWMKATWPSVYTSLPFRIWFPKLAETKNGKKVSAAFDCVNTISNDWNEVVFDDLKKGYVEGKEQYTVRLSRFGTGTVRKIEDGKIYVEFAGG